MTNNALLLHSMATPETDALGCGGVAARLGLDGIELIISDEYPSAVSLNSSAGERERLRRQLHSEGTPVTVLSSYERNLSSDDPAQLRSAVEQLTRTIALAADLGVRGVRLVVGRGSQSDDRLWRDEAHRFIAGLAEITPLAEAARVDLYLENHMDSLAESAEATARLVREVSHPSVGILYDQANLAILGAEQPAEAIRIQRDVIKHVHVKNFRPTRTDRVPVGLADGVVDWEAVLAGLGWYQGTLTFEYERRWYPLLDAATGLAEDVRLVRRRLTSVLASTDRQEK